ncbi:MAG: alpha/beta hydrolase fold domain-containing protein [Actinomycetota bacterium]|nr:alpha/beta hydrolase fold domain-containing protein [Actinomycetota bacterium]
MRIDPGLFDPSAVDPETVDLNEQLERLSANLPNPIEVGIEALREARVKGRGLFGPIVHSANGVDRTIPGPVGDLGIRVFTPETVGGVYLHFHGGGWAMGAADYQDGRLEETARRAGVVVISVDYRLAPEHPYPAPADDAEAAARWIVENAVDEFGTDRIVVGGSSSGAHLAVTAMLRVRDRHGYEGFAGANLVYGFFDLSLTPSARNWGDRMLVMDTALCRWFADMYADGADVTDPDVSPMYADLSDLAPALFTVGTLDPLLDDTLLLSARWTAAGNSAELTVVPGAAHGFAGAPTRDGETARTHMDRFIAERVF